MDSCEARGATLRPARDRIVNAPLIPRSILRMREADDAAVRRARVFVDTPAATHEGGDVALALKAGAIPEDHVRGDLFGLCRGTIPGRGGAEEITLFKSVGTALEDLAAAMLVWRRLGAT